MTCKSYDIVIIGHGPAACAAAISLRQLCDLSVLIVAPSIPTNLFCVGESIPAESKFLLKQLGVWDHFICQSHQRCLGSQSSWGSPELGYNDFLFNINGHGWHLNRKLFNELLIQQVAELSVAIKTGLRLSSVKSDTDGYFKLSFCNEDNLFEQINSRYVIDATGFRSSFATRMGAQKKRADQLICACGYFYIPHGKNFSELTLLEAVEDGWWYAARLPNDLAAVVFATDAQIAKDIKLNCSKSWLMKLTQTRHIAENLLDFGYVSNSLQLLPAHSFLLDQCSGKNWLAVGDAASTYDPISSQGIYKALTNGISGARAILNRENGDKQAMLAYSKLIEKSYQDYLQGRQYFYQLEDRWQHSLFWQNRCRHDDMRTFL